MYNVRKLGLWSTKRSPKQLAIYKKTATEKSNTRLALKCLSRSERCHHEGAASLPVSSLKRSSGSPRSFRQRLEMLSVAWSIRNLLGAISQRFPHLSEGTTHTRTSAGKVR